MIAQSTVFDRAAVLADPMRCRVLLLLEKRELSVAELVLAMQQAQSNVSRHLKALADEGLVVAREEGPSNRYSMRADGFDGPARKLWSVLREQTGELPAAKEDARRLASVLSERRTRSQLYFSSAAGQWDKIRHELFGENTHLTAMLSLLDPEMTVGDLGTGTGLVAHTLAPFVRRIIAIDDSAAMLNAARKRLSGIENVELRRGNIEALPIADCEVDLAVLLLVLPFVDDPLVPLREARRIVRDSGRVLIVDMVPHDREDIAREMGHIWRGFSEETVRGWGEASGFDTVTYRTIPPDPAARGPSLFAAVMG